MFAYNAIYSPFRGDSGASAEPHRFPHLSADTEAEAGMELEEPWIALAAGIMEAFREDAKALKESGKAYISVQGSGVVSKRSLREDAYKPHISLILELVGSSSEAFCEELGI